MPYKDKQKAKEHKRQYYLKNKERILNKSKQYFLENSERIKERQKEYRKTKLWRAKKLIECYQRMDINNGFGNVIDFDAKWIVENIFTKKCTHCLETDWHKLGCNRLVNSKGHTKDNVEPCCYKHNIELEWERKKKQVDQIDKVTGEIITSFSSTKDVKSFGFNPSSVSDCCRGGYYQKGKWVNVYHHKGYIWKYTLMN